ncbi:MAG TPA: tetratricopeptide repeat protein [Xanthomonadales bacterium]|nr:tetratricopeptide repeat protein [Xanthomonadales bacterium]
MLVLPATQAADDNAGADVLERSLQAEFALQGGDVEAAAQGYAAAAVVSDQVQLIERAATVALYAKDYAAADRVGLRWLQVEPASIGARRTLAWAALSRGQQEPADRYLAELAAIGGLEAQRAIAQVLVAAENRANAPASLRRLAEAGALAPLANGPSWSAVASNLGDYPTAVRLAEVETRAQPKSAEAWRRSAQVSLAAGDKSAARKSLERALELAPEDFDLRLALAGIHADAGKPDLADRVLAKAKPQDDRVLAARLANAAAKPESKLLKRIERELLDSRSSQVHSRAFLLGQLYELREQPDKALAWYAKEPDGITWHEAQLRRSVLTARDLNDMAGARTLLAAARQQVADVDQRIDAYLLEAELLTPTDRSSAGGVYDEAIAEYPRDFRLRYARALFRIEDNDISGLEQDLRSILKVDPDNPQALNALGYTLADRTDRHQEALGYIERAIARHPDDGAFVDSMGWVQYRLGNLDEALRYLRRAFELVQDGEVAAHLGEVLWASKLHDEARKHWREALRRWPDSAPLRDSVRQLQPELLP